jgi:hypothetical protein
MRWHLMTFAAFLVQPNPPALALGVESSTRMATTAPMRAKANVMTLISARSRKPTRVEVSMLSKSFRACSASNTVVLPVLTTCFGPRTAWAGCLHFPYNARASLSRAMRSGK